MIPDKSRVHRVLEAGMLGLLLSLIFPRATAAQNFERIIDGVPIERNGALFEFPFFGGLDRFIPQFVDIDGDGDFDLIFSGADGRLTFWENIGTPQVHHFRFITDHYESLLVNGWFYFVDSDADRDFDLYHDNAESGLAFHRNIGSKTRAQFVLVTNELLDSEGQKIFNETTSIPTFADIDADGDVEFFTGLSIGFIVFYRNAGSPQVPLFKFETARWQDLRIFSFGKASILTQPKIPNKNIAHGANGIEFADLDADGDKDFFYGDLFHKSIYYLQNTGVPQEPEVVAITDTLFPPPQPLITLGFNIPRFADIDADGDADFFAACLNQDRNHFIFLQNTGNAAAPKLEKVTDNFLSIVDEGSNSAPALADIDGDGDQDLLIGNLDGQLIFYENIGTASAPAFRWLTDTFQNIQLAEFAITPTFVDIDGDSDFDLFVGSFLGKLAFVENRGNATHPDFLLITKEFGSIDVGNASAPHFADFDRDGDPDLFIGEQSNGVINIFENTGSPTQPRFEFKKEFRPDPQIEDSLPFLYDWDNDGVMDLFIGERQGAIHYYRGVTTGDYFAFSQSAFAGIDAGFSSAPAFADLDGDGNIDLLIGEQAGGINFFRGSTPSAVNTLNRTPNAFELYTHPNPFSKNLHISMQTKQPVTADPLQVEIYNLLGARVTEIKMKNAGNGLWRAEWLPANLVTGVYFLRAQMGEYRAARKILFTP